MNKLLPIGLIERMIHLIRGQKVMIDSDLAILYGIETKYLKRQVKRNIKRFPGDFMFQLTRKEYQVLRCQIGTLERGGFAKYLPYVFTEQGVAMLSSVLNSERAIQVNIAIVRAFVKIRKLLSTNKELAVKLAELELKMGRYGGKIEKFEVEIKVVFEAIRRLMLPPEKPPRKIGFVADRD